MQQIDKSVFVSYAWGGDLERKEWIRDHVLFDLNLVGLPVFWDRDNIKPGHLIDSIIAAALNKRPLHILCICDADYLKALDRADSGLAREFEMIKKIAADEQVLITPLLFEGVFFSDLPVFFRERLAVDFSELAKKKLNFGHIVMALIAGATQTEIIQAISYEVDLYSLWQRANNHLAEFEFSLHGNPRTHEIFLQNGERLLPPEWMLSSSEWGDRMREDEIGFSPWKGIWHWDHWTPSTGMQALGIAICSALFRRIPNEKYIAALSTCGRLVSEKIISFTKKEEALNTSGHEIIRIIIGNNEGRSALEKLLI